MFEASSGGYWKAFCVETIPWTLARSLLTTCPSSSARLWTEGRHITIVVEQLLPTRCFLYSQRCSRSISVVSHTNDRELRPVVARTYHSYSETRVQGPRRSQQLDFKRFHWTHLRPEPSASKSSAGGKPHTTRRGLASISEERKRNIPVRLFTTSGRFMPTRAKHVGSCRREIPDDDSHCIIEVRPSYYVRTMKRPKLAYVRLPRLCGLHLGRRGRDSLENSNPLPIPATIPVVLINAIEVT